MRKRHNKKIKSRFIRYILRSIARWDSCPKQYRKNYRTIAANASFAILACFSLVYLFLTFFIWLS